MSDIETRAFVLIALDCQVHQRIAAVAEHDAAPGAAACQCAVQDGPHPTVWATWCAASCCAALRCAALRCYGKGQAEQGRAGQGQAGQGGDGKRRGDAGCTMLSSAFLQYQA